MGINSHLNLLVFVGSLAGCSRVLGPGRLPSGRAAWLAGCRLLGATGPWAKIIYPPPTGGGIYSFTKTAANYTRGVYVTQTSFSKTFRSCHVTTNPRFLSQARVLVKPTAFY